MSFVSSLWHTWSTLKTNQGTQFAIHRLLVFKFVTQSVVLLAMVFKLQKYFAFSSYILILICLVADFLQL